MRKNTEEQKQIKKEKELTERAKQKCRALTAVIGVLVLAVIGMFIITLTGKNENIIKIVDFDYFE